MDPLQTLDLCKARQANLLREAETDRMLRAARLEAKRAHGTPNPVMARLGDALVAAGTRLNGRPAPAHPLARLTGGEAPVFALQFFQYTDGRTATYMYWRLQGAQGGESWAAPVTGTLAWTSLP